MKTFLYICLVRKHFFKYAIGMLTLLQLVSCSNELHCIMPSDVGLRAGDLVFRRGGSLSSRAVVMADTDKGYSHIGMVVDSAGKAMIVHAVPYEPDFKGDFDRVKLETPQRFFLSDRAIVGEVRRLEDWRLANGPLSKLWPTTSAIRLSITTTIRTIPPRSIAPNWC